MRFKAEIQFGFHFAEPELREQEFVIVPAIQYTRDGFVMMARPGQIHCSIDNDNNYSESCEDGYVTSLGRFVGRHEAATIACASGEYSRANPELESTEYRAESTLMRVIR